VEDVFMNRDGSAYIFGPENVLWFDIEDINLLTPIEMEILGSMAPDPEEIPIRITSKNIVDWRKKLRKIKAKEKEASWEN